LFVLDGYSLRPLRPENANNQSRQRPFSTDWRIGDWSL
jgi:hypothetical protein